MDFSLKYTILSYLLSYLTSKEIDDCFAASYKTVFKDVGYDKAAMSELLKDITDDISGNCVCST